MESHAVNAAFNLWLKKRKIISLYERNFLFLLPFNNVWSPVDLHVEYEPRWSFDHLAVDLHYFRMVSLDFK